jgi:hypothetical protein
MTITPTNTTLLSLAGYNQPPYSTRGLQQTITPIGQATQLVRTVNGALTDLSAAQFRKFSITINGSNQVQPPALDGVWPGAGMLMEAIVEMGIEGVGTDADTDDFDRPPVAGSIRTEGDFTFYRADLDCMVVSFTITRDEWGELINWSLVLEEV